MALDEHSLTDFFKIAHQFQLKRCCEIQKLAGTVVSTVARAKKPQFLRSK